jgi:hypothetical protein
LKRLIILLSVLMLTACIHDPWRKDSATQTAPSNQQVAAAGYLKERTTSAITRSDIASVKATDAKWVSDLYGSSYPEAALQVATAGATELRTWPGTERNYQLAYADWFASVDRLDADILSRNMRAYRRHVVQLALRRRVDWPDAAHLVRLSFSATP